MTDATDSNEVATAVPLQLPLQSPVVRVLIGFAWVVAAMFAASSLTLVGALVAAAAGHELDRESLTNFTSYWTIGIFIVTELGLMLASFVASRIWNLPAGLQATKHNVVRSIVLVLPLIGAVVGVPLIAQIVDNKLFERTPNSAGLIAGTILIALVVAIAEEWAFRGVLIDILGGKRAVVFSTAGSAILFGSVHLLSIDGTNASNEIFNAVAVTFSIGVPLALVRLRTDSIVGPVVLHFVLDALALLTYGGRELPAATLSEHISSLAGAVVVAVGYVAWYAATAKKSALHPIELKDSTQD